MDIAGVIPPIVQLIPELRQWFEKWVGAKKRRNEEEKEAIKALLNALTKTRIYLNDLDSGVKPNRDREKELAEAWSTAALSFLDINQRIAPLLQMKSEAWAHPEHWSDKRVRKSKITIDEMSELARKLLSGEALTDKKS